MKSFVSPVFISSVLATCLVVVVAFNSGNAYPLYFYLVLCLGVLIIFRKNFIAALVFFSNICFNVGLYFFYIFKYGVPYFQGGSDDLYAFEVPAYEILSRVPDLNYLEYIIQMAIFRGGARVVGYQYLVSVFMKIGDAFGLKYHTLIPIFFNTFVLASTCLLIYKLCVKHLSFTQKEATMSSLIYGFFPLVVFVNSHVFRDSIFNLLVMSFIYLSFVRNWMSRIVQAGVILLVAQIRPEYSMVLLGFWLVYSIVEYIQFNFRSYTEKTLGVSVLMTFFLAIVGALYYSIPYLQSLALKSISLDEYRSTAGLTGFIFKLPWFLRFPAKLLFLILMPYPSLTGPAEQIFQGFGSLIQVAFTPIAFWGWYKSLFRSDVFKVAYWFFIFFMLIGLGSVDFKHKPTLIMLGGVMLVFGLRGIRLKKKIL